MTPEDYEHERLFRSFWSHAIALISLTALIAIKVLIS